MPKKKFSVPDEVVLIYHDPDNKQNNIVLRYFAGDIPKWISHIDIPTRDVNLINDRRQGKNFKSIIEDVPPGESDG